MTSTLFDLTGKTALVTGGARGIGAAICATLAEYGARIMVSDVDEAAAISTSRELAASGMPHGSIVLDVSDRKSAGDAIAETIRQFGKIDILVNNAGINTAGGRVTIEEYCD